VLSIEDYTSTSYLAAKAEMVDAPAFISKEEEEIRSPANDR